MKEQSSNPNVSRRDFLATTAASLAYGLDRRNTGTIAVYDLDRSTTMPHAVMTGDTLFVGDVGRPDLRASLGWSAADLGSLLYDSLREKLLTLPGVGVILALTIMLETGDIGRFRGVGGILTGAMGALQDWDVIWRFAYSHNQKNLFAPSSLGYFDLASDPLNQAADRAAVMLYLRGDLQPAKGKVAIALTEDELEHPSVKRVPPVTEGPSWVTWVAQLGTVVAKSAEQLPKNEVNLTSGWNGKPDGVTAFAKGSPKLAALLKCKGVISALDDPEAV